MNRECTLGFLMGIGTGIALGVLFAPKSGAATRNFLSEQVETKTNEVRKQASEALASATAAVERGRTEFAKTTEGVKNAVEAGTRAYRETLVA